MKNLPLKVIIEKIGGRIVQGMDNLIINGLVTRTARLAPGVLLFDLYREENLNPNISHNKCSCAIVTDNPVKFSGFPENVTIIRTPNINAACWKFVEFYRSLFNIPVIGVTGTCGKTTTKEMIKHILSGKYKVNATYKSYNASFRNLGYLLDVDDETEMAVYEMGVAASGDLKTSCMFFKPRVGVITNIGIDHLQAFGTLEAYIRAKAEIIEGLDFKGILILNADDENIQKIDLQKYKGDTIYFGAGTKSHFKISSISHIKARMRFSMRYREKNYDLLIPGYGEFNVYNAAAAIAAAHAVGFDIDEAGARLASFQNVEKHFEFNEGINGSTIIDDTWSTNPTSTEAALKLLKYHSKGKKTIAALGKMSLLGEQSNKFHYKIGEKVAEIGIDHLIAIGEGAVEIGLGALQKGMKQDKVYFCKDSDETYDVLVKTLDENSIALVKTSMMASYTDLMEKILVKRLRTVPNL